MVNLVADDKFLAYGYFICATQFIPRHELACGDMVAFGYATQRCSTLTIGNTSYLRVDSDTANLTICRWSGNNDTSPMSIYTITLSDGTTSTFTVKNGQDGTDGVDGINGVNGTDGQDGTDGTNGTNGTNGSDGASAYEIALENGFSGTESAWLLSLKGSDGIDGTDGTNGSDGYTPIKGTDYFTDADIAEIVADVLLLVTDGNEVAY